LPPQARGSGGCSSNSAPLQLMVSHCVRGPAGQHFLEHHSIWCCVQGGRQGDSACGTSYRRHDMWCPLQSTEPFCGTHDRGWHALPTHVYWQRSWSKGHIATGHWWQKGPGLQVRWRLPAAMWPQSCAAKWHALLGLYCSAGLGVRFYGPFLSNDHQGKCVESRIGGSCCSVTSVACHNAVASSYMSPGKQPARSSGLCGHSAASK